jgi:Ca2+:H+ antiporter
MSDATRPSRANAVRNGLRVLLVFVPIAAIAAATHASAQVVFVCAALAILPLAGELGHATDLVASRLGAGVGGLLNATFGNAAELILAIAALQHGLHDIVKATLTGSIIGNSLLVLGLSLVAGGARRERQRFDRVAAAAGTTMMALAAIGLLVPALFHEIATHGAPASRALVHEHDVSVQIAVVLFAAYVLSLLFSLRTHRHLYIGGQAAERIEGSLGRAVIVLLTATALIAGMSELLAGAVQQASLALGMTPIFVGVIVLAVVGNAAEHSVAVLAAMRDRVDLAFHVAVGSSMQIALLVAPLLVFISRGMPGGAMDLCFTPFEVLAVAVSVVVVHLVSQDGESNWLEGALLLAVYVILAIAFYYLP